MTYYQCSASVLQPAGHTDIPYAARSQRDCSTSSEARHHIVIPGGGFSDSVAFPFEDSPELRTCRTYLALSI